MSEDHIFAAPRSQVTAFKFDENVAGVFDNMIKRSVPGYELITDMTAIFARKFFRAGQNIYDLGASLGTASMAVRVALAGETNGQIIAVDNSAAMTKRCAENLQNSTGSLPFEVRCEDVQTVKMRNAGMVIMNYTMQFLPPEDREAVLNNIYHALVPGGILLLSEKITFAEQVDSELFIDIYHRWKAAHGYSPLEIVQKRDALENVLIPDTAATHLTRLQKIGFEQCQIWFQSFNFASFTAFKPC